MSFNDFILEYSLEYKPTSNIKIYQVLSSLVLCEVGIYLRDGPFSDDIRIVNLHPSKETHWFAYINEKYFVSYGCSPPQKVSKIFVERNERCVSSEYKKQSLTSKRDS